MPMPFRNLRLQALPGRHPLTKWPLVQELVRTTLDENALILRFTCTFVLCGSRQHPRIRASCPDDYCRIIRTEQSNDRAEEALRSTSVSETRSHNSGGRDFPSHISNDDRLPWQRSTWGGRSLRVVCHSKDWDAGRCYIDEVTNARDRSCRRRRNKTKPQGDGAKASSN